jgi:hypothetical protein
MCSECIHLGIGHFQFRVSGRHCVKATCVNEQADVLHAEKCVIRHWASVLSWPEKEEKGNFYHVGDCFFVFFLLPAIGQVKYVNNNYDRDWLEICWGVPSLIYAQSYHVMQKLISPMKSFWTSSAPSRANGCPTARIVSSAVRDWTHFLLG